MVDLPPPKEYLTFPDGDVVLQSEDGVHFQLDSLILRRASPFFAAMFALPQNDLPQMNPIAMSESAEVIDHVMRSIYPSGPVMHIPSADHAVEALCALQKYEISNQTLTDHLGSYLGAIQPSIRAWALAIKSNSSKARSLAVRNFLLGDGDGLENIALELEGTDGWRVLHLLRVKKKAMTLAGVILTEWTANAFCVNHRLNLLVNKAKTNPLDTDVFSDRVLYYAMKGVQSSQPCSNCATSYSNLTTPRRQARRRLEDLMENAVVAESQGLELEPPP